MIYYCANLYDKEDDIIGHLTVTEPVTKLEELLRSPWTEETACDNEEKNYCYFSTKAFDDIIAEPEPLDTSNLQYRAPINFYKEHIDIAHKDADYVAVSIDGLFHKGVKLFVSFTAYCKNIIGFQNHINYKFPTLRNTMLFCNNYTVFRCSMPYNNFYDLMYRDEKYRVLINAINISTLLDNEKSKHEVINDKVLEHVLVDIAATNKRHKPIDLSAYANIQRYAEFLGMSLQEISDEIPHLLTIYDVKDLQELNDVIPTKL